MSAPTEQKIRAVGHLRCTNCRAKLHVREHGGGRRQRWCSDACRMAYGRRKKPTLFNGCRPRAERGLDAYFTPPEAVRALMRIENLPLSIADPCCGNGAILNVLREAGHIVHGADIRDYGWPHTVVRDYLAEPIIMHDVGIVSNPPYMLALEFLQKAIADGAAYHAWLLRSNFLESNGRLPFFASHPPSRIWISSRRLPVMHREGGTGPRTGSNACMAWFVWMRARKNASSAGSIGEMGRRNDQPSRTSRTTAHVDH